MLFKPTIKYLGTQIATASAEGNALVDPYLLTIRLHKVHTRFKVQHCTKHRHLLCGRRQLLDHGTTPLPRLRVTYPRHIQDKLRLGPFIPCISPGYRGEAGIAIGAWLATKVHENSAKPQCFDANPDVVRSCMTPEGILLVQRANLDRWRHVWVPP